MALIYIVEDDESIREIEEFTLKNAGFAVEGFDCAKAFYKKMEVLLPELVILDVMLPDENGIEILHKLREKKQTAKLPVIMVTAKTSDLDLVKGLDGGADDYIRKPFSVMELMSRVKAVLRRTLEKETRVIQIGNIVLDHEKHKVKVAEENIDLTFKEYELLRYLMMNQNIVLSRDDLMNFIWGEDFAGESRTLDMHIKTLRQKLGEEGSRIRTVRNVGYSIE